MKIYRRRVERRGINGEYPVYDNKSQWAKEVSDGVLRHWSSKEFKVGDWVEYADGKIAQVIIIDSFRVKRKSGKVSCYPVVGTVLNMFYMGTTTPITGFYSPYYTNLFSREVDLNRGSTKLNHFVESWLIHGMKFEDALRKYLRNEWAIWKKLTVLKNPNDNQLFTFGCWLLTGKWFDDMLKQNRIIRDRYMSLIGAFELEGLTSEYFAKKIKEMIDSGTEKERINALNKLADILTTFERQDRKKLPVFGASVVEEEALEKSINNNNLLIEGDINERQYKTDENVISDKEFHIQKGSKTDERVLIPSGQGLQYVQTKVQTEEVNEQLVEQEIDRILGND